MPKGKSKALDKEANPKEEKPSKQEKGAKPQGEKPNNANGEGSVYQCKSGRHTGKWVAQVTIGTGPNGRLKFKKAYCKTHPEAKRKLKELLKDIEEGIDLQLQAGLTLREWITTWMDLYRKNSIGLSTWQSHNYQVKATIIPALGDYLLKDLTTEAIQKMYNKMVEEKYARATVVKAHQILSMCINKAVEKRVISWNMAKATELPRAGDDDEVKAMTEEEMQLFLGAIQREREIWRVIFLTLLGTGLREGEALALRWSNVNFRERTAKVTETVVRITGQGLTFTDPKTKKSRRVVPLPKELAAVLRLHRIHQAKERLKAGDKYQNNDLVFCTDIGRPIEARNLIRVFHRIRDKLGFSKDLTVHSLRHTFATRLLEERIDLKTVSELLGHKDISTTGNIYAHVMPRLKTGAADKMNELLKRKKAPPPKGKVLTLER